EIEQPPALTDRAGQVGHRLQPQRAADVSVDRFEHDDAGATRKAQRPTILVAARDGDARNGSGAKPFEQPVPIEGWAVGETQRQGAFRGVAATPAGAPQVRGREGEDVANRVIELPDALEAGGERDV